MTRSSRFLSRFLLAPVLAGVFALLVVVVVSRGIQPVEPVEVNVEVNGGAGGAGDPDPKATLGGEPSQVVDVQALPHVRVDREQRRVEFDARVVLRESDWLELLVCSPRTREHESILVTDAKPSHLHLALLTVGLQPGKPMTWRRTEDAIIAQPPNGDPIEVVLMTERDGAWTGQPASDWIVHRDTDEPMPDSRFMFTGSRFKEVQGRQVYMADIEGTVISLVNFGDDLMVRRTEDQGGQGLGNPDWVPHTKHIPPIGTKVIVRLQPVEQGDGQGDGLGDGQRKSASPGGGDGVDGSAVDR